MLVRLDLDLNGIFKVTATESATGLSKQVVIENMMERFGAASAFDALERLDRLFGVESDEALAASEIEPAEQEAIDPALQGALSKA